MSIPPEALISNFHSHVEAADELKGDDHELLSHFKDGDHKVVVVIEDIEEIEPGQDSGTFVMRLKHEIIENRGKIMIITGASLLALSGLIIQRKRSHKN